MEQTIKRLKAALEEDGVFVEEPMAGHTTFRTGGVADLFLMPNDPKQVFAAIQILREEKIPYLVVGNGSNLLVGDKGIRGAVLQIGSRMSQIEEENGLLKAQGGALLSALSAKAAELSLGGLEFASGIPGSVGGGVVMNAGAYDSEMKDVLLDVDILNEKFEIETIPVEKLALSYRHSVIADMSALVLSARFSLEKKDQKEIKARMAELAEQRREKQPLQYPSAGSTFKRPQGYFAGKLIEDAGLKGKTIGGAQVSEKHAGFIINTGGATTRDILDLIAFCRQEVFEKFGVWLEPEVKVVGEV